MISMSMTVVSYARRPPDLIGGALCLDFVNTVGWRGNTDHPGDHLTSYDELLIWSEISGALNRAEGRSIKRAARQRKDVAGGVLNTAIELREALAQLFTGTADSHGPLMIVNDLLAQAPARRAIAPLAAGFDWQTDKRHDLLLQPLWPVLWSATDLLTSERLQRVGSCRNPSCGWLFLDLSRNRSRRWCSMADCGNRAKARRHYARQISKNA
jgi:predicted RNA-binding Zn ribbon-like protein